MSWYGPVYHEAAMFEEKLGNVHAAIAIAERGRHAVPRYGPLWFDLLRLQEKAFPLAVEPRRRLSQVRCLGIHTAIKDINADSGPRASRHGHRSRHPPPSQARQRPFVSKGNAPQERNNESH